MGMEFVHYTGDDGVSETLILDEDGVYDPGDFNDRLLLDLKEP